MIRKFFFAALFAAMAIPAQAGILTFNQADLDSFTVQSATASYTINDLTANLPANAVVVAPAYSDGLTPMSGVAGATGSWPAVGFGSSAEVLLGSSFAATDLSGYTDLKVIGFNDNDDVWGFGVWIETVADGLVSSSIVEINGSTAPAPHQAILSLDLGLLDLTEVTGYGVSIHGTFSGAPNDPSPADAFHASWAAVPEPASAGLWATMGIVGVFASRRRRS